MKSVLLFLLLAGSALAQKASSPAPTPARIEADYWEGAIILNVGEMSVAPHQTGRFQAEVKIEKEGWVTSYSGGLGYPKEFGPKELRFTVANASRTDLLCKDRDETIVNFIYYGPSWPDIQGYGYHLRAGDRLRVSLEIDNKNGNSIENASLSIDLKYQLLNEPPFRRDAYPMWFNSRGCGAFDYDLNTGKNISSGTFEIPVTGTLVALQGALRSDAEYLEAKNRSRELTFLRQDWMGRFPLPLVKPKPGNEFRVDQGDFVAVEAAYNNPSGSEAKDAGIGVALGLFVPVDDAKMKSFEKKEDSATAQPTAAKPRD